MRITMDRYRLATSTWDDAELNAIREVIESDMYSMGPQVATYEQQFAKTFDSNYCVMVNSGSSANLLMIASLFYRKHNRLKRGDEIIVPAVGWSTTYAPLQQYGLKVKFVDIDRDTLNIDLKQLKEAVTDNTKAIMVVNLLGNPVDMNELMNIAGDRIVLEDNCESMGATYLGKAAGSFGLMGTFSSFFSHHISTMEGGCIVTDDEELYHILLCLRSHGWTRNLPENNHVTGTKSTNAFEESFKFALPGYNVRPIEMSGAIGQQQLKKLPAMLEQRKANAQLFKELFADIDVITQQEVGTSSWFGFSIVTHNHFMKQNLVKAYQDNNIECRKIVSGNFLRSPMLEFFDYKKHSECTNAEYIDAGGLFVGNSHENLSDQLQNLAEITKRTLQK